jgi:hypothetical protein
VGLRAGLDRCGKSLPHRDSILRPSSPVASRYTDYAIPLMRRMYNIKMERCIILKCNLNVSTNFSKFPNIKFHETPLNDFQVKLNYK